ncbi:hypothetical protein HHTV1_46 [Haloarcula hispanica tailed virus 1]|uniref:Uncharacterized protein n=1 Tax=Haloarcula hispanica tailed virus 1 TaxID=1273750 RepID=R4T8S4_9CAUD|nr:hypothetical protein M198_gp46 [Haloarcula hispanica tailed virus 1]AGM11300.1 hypothetical protein HHTV1_46 [Haloarcula hispanica tailed virus 1]
MMSRIGSLVPGEHVDLDSGVTIERKENGDQFRVIQPDFGHVVLNKGQIRAVAEAANFSVKNLGDA